MSDIVYIKLITGDEIIGDRLGEDEDSTMLVLKHPMVMSEVLNPYSHSSGVTLSKYMVFGDDLVVPIKIDHIVAMSTPLQELKDFYTSSVTYTDEITSKEVAYELARADKATRTAIIEEREKVDVDYIDIDDDSDLFMPANTTLH